MESWIFFFFVVWLHCKQKSYVKIPKSPRNGSIEIIIIIIIILHKTRLNAIPKGITLSNPDKDEVFQYYVGPLILNLAYAVYYLLLLQYLPRTTKKVPPKTPIK